MKNKRRRRRRRKETKTVPTAVERVAIGLVLHRPHCALLSGGFTYGNEQALFGATASTVAIYHCIFFTATKLKDAFPFYSTASSVSIVSHFCIFRHVDLAILKFKMFHNIYLNSATVLLLSVTQEDFSSKFFIHQLMHK